LGPTITVAELGAGGGVEDGVAVPPSSSQPPTSRKAMQKQRASLMRHLARKIVQSEHQARRFRHVSGAK
jgi:hypothetical protein